VSSFVERVGAVLVAPRRAMREAATAPVGHGSADVAWLIAAKLVAGETPRLARALVRGMEAGPGAALLGLVTTAQQVLPDVLGVLIASVVMSLLSGRGRGGGERALDLAAYAWVPYLAVEVAAALAFTALGRPPSDAVSWLVAALGAAWAAMVWALGLAAARGARRDEGAAK
jgi:hypothetical protein